MAINSTTNLGLALPDQGEWDGTWGTNLNEQITELIDSAVAGTTTLSVDDNITLDDTDFVANESRQAIILWTASNGATTRNITAPARSKTYVVINAGTGSIVFRGAGPTTGVTIIAGRKSLVAWNGSDFVEVAGGLVNLATGVTGILPVANGGTGTATPALVAGTNTTVSGSWPNQTVNAVPTGSNQQIQFNNAGAFGASADLAWNGVALNVSTTALPNWSIGAVNTSAVSSVAVATIASNYYFNSGDKRIGASTRPTRYRQFDGEHIWSSAAAGAADSAITFTQVMKADINDNIKIGTGEPSYKLDVDGTFGASGLATLSGGATVSGTVTFAGQTANSIPYLSGSNVFTTSSNLTYNTTTLAMQTTGTTAPVFDITATNSGGAAIPTMRFIRTTTSAVTSFVGQINWRQTQTDGSVVAVGNIVASSSNNPATLNGTLTLQAEKEIVLQSTSTGSWLSASGTGVTVNSDLDATAPLDVVGNRIRVQTAKTPASATDTGNEGEICWDSSYVYVCVATDTWKRTALSTW